MKNLMQKFWSDEAGLVLSAELVFVASIAGIGMIVGLSAARDGITSELADVGDAVTEYNQSYTIAQIVGHGAAVAGTQYIDNTDYCDNAADDGAALTDEGCIVRNLNTTDESNGTSNPSQIP